MLTASPSDLVTKAANALDLWCPSSKTALFKFTLRYSGHRASMPLSQAVPNSSTHSRAMHITMAGSYSRCIMVVTFDQSVWVCQRGSMKHPRWNCATPSTDVLLHADRIEPSFAACATGGPGGIRTHVQNYYSCTIFLRNS